MTSEGNLTLGVIVCCRDEARVIERRLWNLALSCWPASSRPHVVVVVDDGSSDATASVAAKVADRFEPDTAQLQVISNRLRPGKSGAIESALAHLEGRVDLCVLTDADVVNDPLALKRLEEAFRRDTELGMACGAQVFVRALPWQGTIDATLMRNSGSFYDRTTAWVRRLESIGGRVFSVHGQLLAWRAELGLAPKSALAADDLDLMRQVVQRGLRVELVQEARFFELRPWTRELQRAQALRRARAYLQFARTMTTDDLHDPWQRVQWLFYKLFPPTAPWIGMSCVLLVTLGGVIWWWSLDLGGWPDGRAKVYGSALWLLCAQWVGRRAWSFLGVIEEARQLERTQSMDDRWSTAR